MPDDPPVGPGEIVARFIGTGLFGGFVSLVIFLTVIWGDFEFFWRSPLRHLLWIIPLAWGIVGIFRFDEMLDPARRIFSGFFGVDSDE